MIQQNISFPQSFLFSNTSLLAYSSKKNAILSVPFDLPHPHFAESIIHSLINNQLIPNLPSSFNQVVEHADRTQLTIQHKVLFLTFKYFNYQIQKTDKRVWLIKWLSDAQKLFVNKKQENKLLELVYDGDLEDFLGQLKLLKQKKRRESGRPSMEDRINFLMELAYKRILAIDSELSNHSHQKKTKEYFENNTTNLEHEKQVLFSQPTQNKQLNQILSACTSILLGNEEFIFKTSPSFYSFAKLYLLYVQDESIDAIEEKFNERCRQKNQTKPVERITHKYLLELIKNENYHQTYQLSLSILPPFFAHLLGSLAFYIIPKVREIKFNDPEYKYRVMINLIDEGSKISAKTFFGCAKLYEELQAQRTEHYEEIQNLMYKFLPYEIIDSYEKLKEIKENVEYLMEINLNQYYLRNYINNLLSLHLNEPISKFTIELIILELNLYYPDQLEDFSFPYFQQGYLLESNLQLPWDFTILSKVRQVTGENTIIRNKKVCNDFLNHFESFFLIDELNSLQRTEQKTKMLIELMNRQKFEAKGEILRTGKKLINEYNTYSSMEKQNCIAEIIDLRDNLKLYIEDMEDKKLNSPELHLLKKLLY